jgi:FkbM family methyltransferase
LRRARLQWSARRSARALFTLRPLGYYPGWRFGSADEADPRTRKRLRLWARFQYERLEVPVTVPWYGGLEVRLYLGNDLSRCLFVGGCYEPNEFAFLNEVLAPGMTFVDVGANDGLYSLFAARRVGPAGTVLAFEPSAREFARLSENCRLNGLANVRAFPVALAAGPGAGTLFTADSEHAGQNTLGRFIYDGVACARTEAVPLEALDDVLARHNGPAPDVIKMDVEGAEHAVLRGAAGTLATHRPLLLLELNDPALRAQQSSSDEVLSLLRSLGYSILTFDEATGRPVPAETDRPPSHNIVAVHPQRAAEFGGTGCVRGSWEKTPC